MNDMKARPLVSIVTPTFNRTDKLIALLESIGQSDYPANCLEMIIIDNAADPKLEPTITAMLTGLTVITPGKNLYSNAARKLGAELARGQYLFFLDDDNTIAPNCLSELIDTLETHTTLGAVCPIMLKGDSEEIWCAGARLTRLGTCLHLYQSQILHDTRLPKLIEHVDYLPNAFVVRREALLAAPFDGGSLPHNWSEIDFGLRISQAGYGLACVTGAIDRHHIGYSGPLTRLRPETVYDQARSRLVFRKRHFGRIIDWLLFWGIIFPVSSIVYFRQMVQSSSSTWSLLRSYVRGTLDGIIASDPLASAKRSGPAWVLALVRMKFCWASNARRVFRNWPEVWGRVALSWLGYSGGVFTVETRSGLRLQAPADPLARGPLLEVLSEDAYRLGSIDWATAGPAIVLDIGAHVGTFACALAQRAGRARFVCVEPSPVTSDWLARNLEANNLSGRVTILRAAVAGTDGEGTLWELGDASCESSTIEGRGNPVSVRTVSLESLVSRAGGPPEVVKIDCEGGEYDAIMSSPDWCWKRVRYLFLEHHPVAGHCFDELRDRLHRLGLEPLWHDVGSDPELGMACFARLQPGVKLSFS